MVRKRWIVSKNLKKLLWISIVLSVFMLANSMYLLVNRLAENLDLTFFADSKTSIPRLLQSMILQVNLYGLMVLEVLAMIGQTV